MEIETKMVTKECCKSKKIDTFQNRLNKELKKQGVSQYRLAKITGIPQTTMNNYCCGKYDPKRENLDLIAKVLNVQETWLLGYNVPKQINKRLEKTILSKLSLMNLSELEKISEMMDIIITFGQD